MSHAEIHAVTSGPDYAIARELVLEYARALGVELCFQNFSQELEALPTVYGPPRGFMLLARQLGASVGCVGVREFSVATCEMKRLYVRDRARGTGIGRALVVDAISRARAAGYRRMVLDTLIDMVAARQLYQALGFRECAPYYRSPLPGTIYMDLAMDAGGVSAK
jgi:putative acetyltransferase